MKDKLLKIINHYGVIPQLKHFNSEVFELNEAIIDYEHYRQQNIDCSNCEGYEEVYDLVGFKKHMTEEIADVLVMLYQFIEYYRIQDSDIYTVMEQKTDRQLKRIENE